MPCSGYRRRLRRDHACASPMRHEAGRDAGAANGEQWLRHLLEFPNQLACLLQHGSIDAVEKNRCRAAFCLQPKLFLNLAGVKGAKIDQADGKIRLPRQVEAEIGLVHRGRRVMGHRRMTVDAIDLAPCGREEIAEDQKPAQVRRSHAYGNRLGCEYFAANFQRAPDAATVRRRVESGTDLVVNDRRREVPHAGEDGGQVRRHPLRRARSCIAGEADRLAVGEARQLRGRRRA